MKNPKATEKAKEIIVIPIDEAQYMVKVVENQRDQLINELNNAQLENFRLNKQIAQLQEQMKNGFSTAKNS